VSGQEGSENKECPPFAEVLVEYFNDSLEVSFDIIQHMVHDNLTLLSKISEERSADWICKVKEELGRADEICNIALNILNRETLPSLIKDSDIKKSAGDLRVAVEELWSVHEDLKELLEKGYDEKLARDAVGSAALALDKLETMLSIMIGSISISAAELKNYGYVSRR
jgi:hypothetical protein